MTFHRVLLHRLASGELPMDEALFTRIDRTVDQLKEAAATRDERECPVHAGQPVTLTDVSRAALSSGIRRPSVAATPAAPRPRAQPPLTLPYTPKGPDASA